MDLLIIEAIHPEQRLVKMTNGIICTIAHFMGYDGKYTSPDKAITIVYQLPDGCWTHSLIHNDLPARQ